MTLKEAVQILELQQQYLKDRDYAMKRTPPHGVQQALETVLAAIRRADLTDEEIDKECPYKRLDSSIGASPFDDPKIGSWKQGARHVRDLLHGEGKE